MSEENSRAMAQKVSFFALCTRAGNTKKSLYD